MLQNQLAIMLASRSPRRRELLEQIGVSFELVDIEIDESVKPGESPLDYVVRIASEKAESAWHCKQIRQLHNYQKRALLAADTCVVLKDRILGKPESPEQALQMLTELSAKTHQVMTCVALKSRFGLSLKTSLTQVSFAQLSPQAINAYCRSGEGLDKAGGYAIQGKAAQFITAIKGSYSGVVGLPLHETSELLQEFEQKNAE